jgi:hypothetical protein
MLCAALCCCAVRVQADETLAKFLDFCTYGHMIDNVVLIVTGSLHERDVQVCTGLRRALGEVVGRWMAVCLHELFTCFTYLLLPSGSWPQMHSLR